MPRTCLDCAAHITRQSRTGRCKPCATRVSRENPAIEARRLAALRTALRTPEARAAKSASRRRTEAERRNDPAWIVYKRDCGRKARALYDASPEAQARNLAARARVGAKLSARRMAWCPTSLRDDYQMMRRKVGAPAARAAIEDEIRRAVAATLETQRVREQQRRSQAY